MVSEDLAGALELARRGAEAAAWRLNALLTARSGPAPYDRQSCGQVMANARLELGQAQHWLDVAQERFDAGL
jgi:hypothetical protein